jgi:hypothetical protein
MSSADAESVLPAVRQMAGLACSNKRRKQQTQTVINKNSMTQPGRYLSSLSVDSCLPTRSIPMTSVPHNNETNPRDKVYCFDFEWSWYDHHARNVTPPFCLLLYWLPLLVPEMAALHTSEVGDNTSAIQFNVKNLCVLNTFVKNTLILLRYFL